MAQRRELRLFFVILEFIQLTFRKIQSFLENIIKVSIKNIKDILFNWKKKQANLEDIPVILSS